MRWIALYTQKIISLHSLAKHAQTTTDLLCEAYRGQQVGNGLDKAELFKNALSASFTGQEALHLITVCDLPHNQDKRNQLQYATDLIIGWLSEDATLQTLNNTGHQAELIGSDKTRDFLTKKTITHGADIQTPTKQIELVFDYTNHWTKANKLDLRDNKLDYLKENNITLLGIAPRTGKAFLITDYSEFTHGHIPAYNKNGWTLQNVSQHLKPISQIISEI
jgi:hypothetical protein